MKKQRVWTSQLSIMLAIVALQGIVSAGTFSVTTENDAQFFEGKVDYAEGEVVIPYGDRGMSNGTAQSVELKFRQGGNGKLKRKVVYQFDLPAEYSSDDVITYGDFTFSTTYYQDGTPAMYRHVWGVMDGAGYETFDEHAPTGNSAQQTAAYDVFADAFSEGDSHDSNINTTGVLGIDDDDATGLYDADPNTAGIQPLALLEITGLGETTVDDQVLLDFLNTDTNGTVTFILSCSLYSLDGANQTSTLGNNHKVGAHENMTDIDEDEIFELRPTLTVETTDWVPNCDIDGSNMVDDIDLNLMLSSFGWTGTIGDNPADVNEDGVVDDNDLSFMTQQFGEPPPVTSSQAVPEPSAVLLLLLGICGMLGLCRRKN